VTMRPSGTVVEIWRLKRWMHRRESKMGKGTGKGEREGKGKRKEKRKVEGR